MSMKKKILVVEDNKVILDILKMILEEEGYETETSQGEAIFQLIRSFQPHLIILDMFLGKENGADITRKIKGEEKTHHIPVIIISAHPRAKEASKEAGVDTFLAKPFEVHELLSAVQNTIQN